MTHFLGRLVERARGTAPRVEPIIAPRFAPAPVSAEITTENEAVPPAGLPQAMEPPAARRETGPPGAIESPRSVLVRQEKTSAEVPKEDLIESAAPAEPETLLVPLSRPDDDRSQPPARTRESGSLRRDVLLHVQSDAPPAVLGRANHHLPSPISKPSHRAAVSASALTSPNDKSAEPPIVRVTIGRIEVRAAPAIAPAPRRASRAAEPKLTLDAYLKSRKEGAR
jgi:hypothetical protein